MLVVDDMTEELKVMQALTTTPPHGTPHTMHLHPFPFLMTRIADFVGLPTDIQPTAFELS